MPVRKLSVEDVAQLLEKHAAGTSLGDLAAEFDVSRQHVGRLVRARAANDGADASQRLTVEDVERKLEEAVTRGSIGAIKLWFERHDASRSPESDPFAEFDPEGVR